MRDLFRRTIMAGAACSLCISAIAVAETPSDLRDLLGARGSSGETQLEARGYSLSHAAQGDDSSYTYWWNSARKRCVRVTTSDGRYQDIRTEAASDCGQKGGDGTGAAVAIGAAALIGAIALSHKSHNHDDGAHYNNQQYEADYERGYRDGLYNQSYHNYTRSDYYSRGYEAGVTQRGHETSYRPGYGNYGGYSGYVDSNDLIGRSRASAEAELSSRGFTAVESNKTDGAGRYTTWWRAVSKQCLIVNTRDQRVYSVESTRPRNCR